MPLTVKIYTDFYMAEAEKVGVKVEYWDLTALFFGDNHGMEDSSYLINVKKFITYNKLEVALKSQELLSKTLFISIMTFEGRICKLYKILTKYNCNLAVFGRNMFPVPPVKKSVFAILKRIKISTVLNYLEFRKLLKLKKNGKIKNYDVIFMGGALGWQGIGRVGVDDIRNTQIVNVNSDDYDNFLLLKNDKDIISGDYILFLDEYLPLHPDTVLFNIKNVKEEDYYPELNNYFERVEKQFGLPVVIAAHPKANRYKTEDFFNGRKVFFNETAQLTRTAFFVLAHDSTSINYPIAFGKKLHFITSESIMKGIIGVHRNVLNFADYLGCNYQFMNNIDEKINLVDGFTVEKYENYKYNFQTSPETENKLSSKIFIDFLTK